MNYELWGRWADLFFEKKWLLAGWLVAVACLPGGAQSFAKLEAAADQAQAGGRFDEAAPLYEQAARLRQNRPETMRQAAECYYLLRDYVKAVECYGFARPAFGKSDPARLHYARALKQAGRPAEAETMFGEWASTYAGADRETVLAIANVEMAGCQLAQHFFENQSVVDSAVRLVRLSDSLNSLQNELSPIRWSDDVLYFFTKARGRTELVRSFRSGGEWQAAQPAAGLPAAIQRDLGSGTLSPDGRRFYCTRCPEDDPAAGVYPPCALYLTRRTAEGPWEAPERLRDYVNLPGTTILTPFVARDATREWLFFASNRPGGFGGLDLYGCERPLDADDVDFSFPQNLGAAVNTASDELAPYFDPATATLWFSSNGHVTVGGLDVFQTHVFADGWMAPQHLAAPVNSPADDLFFVPDRSGRGGLLVSNRPWGAAKTSTRHNDLFEIRPLR